MVKQSLAKLALLVVIGTSARAGAQTLTFVDPSYSTWEQVATVSPGLGAIGLLQISPTQLDVMGYQTPGTLYSVSLQSGGHLGSPVALGSAGLQLPQYIAATYSAGGCIFTADSNSFPGDYSDTGIHIIGGVNGCSAGSVGGPQVVYDTPVYDCYYNVYTNDLDLSTGAITPTTVTDPSACPAGATATGPYRSSTDDIRGMTFDAFGNLFFVDNVEATYDNPGGHNGFIGRMLAVGSTGASPGAQTDRFIDGLYNPLMIVFVPGGANGTLYFDAQSPTAIGKAVLDANGNITYLNTDYAESPSGGLAFGLGADAQGRIWLGTYGGGGSSLYMFTDNGTPESSTWDQVAVVNNGAIIRDVAVDASAIYITDASSVHSYAPKAACVPATCAEGACGSMPDGCGGTLDCGACACNPLTSCPDGACGTISDNCGGTLDCGTCSCNAVSYAPGQASYGLVEFEDLWPVKGDLDFNDENTAYNFAFVYDYNNNITGMQATFHVVAVGAGIHNGLYIQVPLDRSLIGSAQIALGTDAGVDVSPIDQLPNQDTGGKPCILGYSTFQIAADTRSLYAGASGFINTVTSQPIRADSPVTLSIAFSQPISPNYSQSQPYLDVGAVPYDLFIARVDDGSHQIHFPNYSGATTCDDPGLFGTGDDCSDSDCTASGGVDNTNRYYVDSDGLPFALNIPQYVDWTIERTPIDMLYPEIDAFALSTGSSDADFYLPSNEVTAYSWQANVTTGTPAPPAAPPGVGSGVFSNITATPCCGPATVTIATSDAQGAVSGAEVGSLYAGAPYYATFTHATWYNTFLYGPSGGIPWPVGGWQGAGDYAISNDLPTPELKSSETEPDVMAVEFSRDVSDVTIRGLDLGYAGAEVDIFDVNGQLLGSGQFTGTGAGNNQFHDFSFPGISGVRRLEFYQVHDLSGDGDLYQALTYTVNDCP